MKKLPLLLLPLLLMACQKKTGCYQCAQQINEYSVGGHTLIGTRPTIYYSNCNWNATDAANYAAQGTHIDTNYTNNQAVSYWELSRACALNN